MRVYKSIDLLEVIRRKGIVETFFHGINSALGMILSKINIFWLQIRAYDIDSSVNLRGNNLFFQSRKNSIKINKNCEIGYGVKLYAGFEGKIEIKNNVCIFDYTIIDVHNKLEIGENCLVAPFCYIGDYDHVLKDSNLPILDQGYVSKPIRIGANVWIGARSIILKGVTIGDNTVIGAGSVVTRDIPSNSVAVGNSARVIKRITNRQ